MKTCINRTAITLMLVLVICNAANAFQFDLIYKKLAGRSDYNSRSETKKNGQITKTVITDYDFRVEISKQKDGTYKYQKVYLSNPDLVEKGTFDYALRPTSTSLYYKGKPSLNSAGYSSRKICYKAGRISEYLYGTDGKPVSGYDGYSIKVLQRPILPYESEYRFEEEEYDDSDYKQVYRISFYDADTIPVECSGIHSKEVVIDSKGIRISYKDEMGKRAASDDGYSDITCRPKWEWCLAKDAVDVEDMLDMQLRMETLKQRCAPTTYLMQAREDIVNYLFDSTENKYYSDLDMIIGILSRPIEIRNYVLNPASAKSSHALMQLRNRYRFPEANTKLSEYLSIVSEDDLYDYMLSWEYITYSPDREPINVEGIACITLAPDCELDKYLPLDMFNADGNLVSTYR